MKVLSHIRQKWTPDIRHIVLISYDSLPEQPSAESVAIATRCPTDDIRDVAIEDIVVNNKRCWRVSWTSNK
jgi:hypothetical protein